MDVLGTLHTFYARDVDQEACRAMDLRLESYGYVGGDESGGQSEKMTALFGVEQAPRDYVLVIKMNTVLSDGSHSFMKALSVMKDRKIVISDKERIIPIQIRSGVESRACKADFM